MCKHKNNIKLSGNVRLCKTVGNHQQNIGFCLMVVPPPITSGRDIISMGEQDVSIAKHIEASITAMVGDGRS